MAINTRVAYIYDSNLALQKQGKLTLDSETGIYAFTEEEAQIQQGEVGTVQVVIILPNSTLTSGTPLITFKTKDGYGSSLLQMSTAENWQITVDGTTTTYQTLYITMSVVGWTYHAGRHALQAVWLSTTGELEKIPMVFYTVQDGINNFDEITADVYEEMSVAFDSVYEDFLDRLSNIELFNLNALGYNSLLTQEGAPLLKLYNLLGNATVSFDGTNLVLNRDSVDEEIITVLNEIGDLANVVIISAATDNVLVNNGTNWVNITKTAFLSAVNARIDTNVTNIALRELLSNKVNEVVSGGTTDQYVNAAALYTKFLTKVDKAFTIAGLDMQSGSITLSALKTAIGEATTSANGLLSASDKTLIDVLRASYSDDDGNSLVDTIKEVLAAFDGYPESTDLMAYFATKVDKVIGKALSTNDLTDELKVQYDDAVVHANTTDGTNPHLTTYANIASKPTTFAEFGLANGSVETIAATTHVTTPKVILATGAYIQYNSTDGSIDFVIE